MVQITHVRAPAAATQEHHITDVRWYDPESGNMNVSNVSGMVQFMLKGGYAYVCNGRGISAVEVMNSPTPYIRAVPTASTGDLLSLPRF